MASLFSPSEVLLDRYSACVAATEPLRANRDARIHRSLPAVQRLFQAKDPSTGKGLCTPRNVRLYPQAKTLCTQHIVNSSKVIKSLGLTVAQFNQVSRKVKADPLLRERVMEQAYLYRLAASLSADRVPLLEDPAAEAMLAAHKRRRTQIFARSLTQIEELRAEQIEQLKRALNVRALPTNFRVCDPNILPFLSPRIQNVCNAFPALAEDVVRKHGMNSDEFNDMLARTNRDPAFRYKVRKYTRKLQEGERLKEKGQEAARQGKLREAAAKAEKGGEE
jgi:hypothetical protein